MLLMKANWCKLILLFFWKYPYYILFLFYNFIYLFLSALGLHCCLGFSLVAVYILIIAESSIIVKHGLQGTGTVIVTHQFSCSVASGNLLRPRVKTMSTALADKFFTTGATWESIILQEKKGDIISKKVKNHYFGETSEIKINAQVYFVSFFTISLLF